MLKKNEKPSYMRALECFAKRCPDWNEGNHCGRVGKLKISTWGQCSHFTADNDEFVNKFDEWWEKMRIGEFI